VPGVSRVDHEGLVAPFMQGLVDAAVIAPGRRLRHHPGDRVRAQETVEPPPVRCGVLEPAVNTIDMNVEVLLAAPRCRRLPLSCPSLLVLQQYGYVQASIQDTRDIRGRPTTLTHGSITRDAIGPTCP